MSAITILSALFAFFAAVLWFVSGRVKTPTSFAIQVVRPHIPPMGNSAGATYVGQAYSEDLSSLANALKRQSKFSAWAAICAGISAGCAGISALLQTASVFAYSCPTVGG